MAKYNKEINKLRIENAAIELFMDKPYKNVTMDQIAKRSGVTKRTVYKYFPSKAALSASLFESYLRRLNDEIVRLIAKDYPFEMALKEAARVLFDFANNNQGLMFMKLFWTLNTNELEGEIPPEVLQHIRLWNRSILDQAVNALGRGNLTGHLSGYSPKQIANLILAVNKGIFIHIDKKNNPDADDTDREELQDLFLALLGLGLGLEQRQVSS